MFMIRIEFCAFYPFLVEEQTKLAKTSPCMRNRPGDYNWRLLLSPTANCCLKNEDATVTVAIAI